MTAGQRRNERDGPPYGLPRGTLQLEELRRSFHRQVEQLKGIDDKAMRSVRTAVVVIGFVVTAVGITLRDGTVSLGVGSTLFTGVGVFFLTVTVVAGSARPASRSTALGYRTPNVPDCTVQLVHLRLETPNSFESITRGWTRPKTNSQRVLHF